MRTLIDCKGVHTRINRIRVVDVFKRLTNIMLRSYWRRLFLRHPILSSPASVMLWIVIGVGILYYTFASVWTYLYPIHNKSMVLIVAYMRSGSSLVGDILQQYDSSFYVFEPLRTATDLSYNNQSIEFLNGTLRKYSSKEEIINLHAELLYNWFTCNFSNLDLGSLTSDYLKFYSITTISYYSCISAYGTGISAVKYCLGYLDSYCIPTEIRIIKTIRLHMESVELLLKQLPRLRVIHLVRDPRGIIHSRVRVKLSTWENVRQEATELCKKMTLDVPVSLKLRQTFPMRFKILLYENLAEKPENVSSNIYSFAGVDFKIYIQHYVRYLTMYGRGLNCYWCTMRGDSKKTSHRWRTRISFKYVKIIDSVCQDVYREIGYEKIHDELRQLRNLSNPLRKQTNYTSDQLW